ncbi:DUF3422 domain-containing protein [Qipengyuania sp. 6B39]|uniref:DUF3422 domain-containing protein n=1 Tax=Qipengyuania proteolytica TaxID=2867239 RepID=UPI001C89C8A0|nr:DUF3422 domain-containing protein [Qipengyuania proteolytica]MBX7497071.1 DUF3422 domain-containing protein [Qipengyuania proteolytica]
MQNHELRQRAVAEMHLRRWPPVPVPCLIVQWVLAGSEEVVSRAEQAIEARAIALDSRQNPSHRSGSLAEGLRFSWERHSEGSSLAFFLSDAGEETFLDPHAHPDLEAALAWAQDLPGDIVRATRIWVARDDAEALRIMGLTDWNRDELVSSQVGGGTLRMWSDFRIRNDGFGRLLVAANGTDTRDLTRTLQRLQELGNYRNRALLGLPVARECWPRLDEAERRLRDLSDRVAHSTERDDALLDALSDLSLDLAGISTAIGFRMDATKAYAQLVEERLDQLDAQPIQGFASLDDFTQRRFRPAMNTCVATTERVRELAIRAEQLSSLLRARIDTRIENQNADLLHSMDRSISMQVRLQQLVEGLSVVALSYYLLGLVKMFLDGLPDGALPASSKAIVGWLVIPTVVAVWLAMWAVKKRVLADKREP